MSAIVTLIGSLILLGSIILIPPKKYKAVINLALLMVMILFGVHLLSSLQILPPLPTSFGGVSIPLITSQWILWIQGLILLSGFFVLLMIHQEASSKTTTAANPEWIFLILASLGGMMLVPASADLVSLWIALELATMPSFLLVAWDKSKKESGEAGIKFLLNSALATAVFLLGLAFLYGQGGTWDFVALAQSTPNQLFPMNEGTRWIAAMLLVAVGFKLGLVPFHLWMADAYAASPWPILTFLSLASKATGLALLIKFVPFLAGFGPLFFALLSALTMTAGNLAAVVQKNIRRLLAFSSISQIGYFLMAFVLQPLSSPLLSQVESALIYYFLVYLVSNAVVLLGVALVCQKTKRDDLSALAGLSQTQPLLALAIMVGLFSLAGIPPLAGFVGKFFLFNLAAQAGFHWLVALAAINSTVSLYYYLQLVRAMYLKQPSGASPSLLSFSYQTGITVATLATAVLGLIPLYDWMLIWFR